MTSVTNLIVTYQFTLQINSLIKMEEWSKIHLPGDKLHNVLY